MLDLFGAFGQTDLKRSATDIVAGRIRVVLGGTTYTLPLLSRRENREWKERLDGRLAGLMGVLTTSGGDTNAILFAMVAAIDPIIDAIVDFDRTHVLGTREEIEALGEDLEFVRALSEVWLAANPLLTVAMAAAIPTTSTPEPPTNGSSEPANSSPRSTAGRRGRSRRS